MVSIFWQLRLQIVSKPNILYSDSTPSHPGPLGVPEEQLRKGTEEGLLYPQIKNSAGVSKMQCFFEKF